MAYSILLAPPAERQLRALTESVQKRIVKRLKSLRDNPLPQGVKKLAGEDDLYRIREGDYRIIYMIRDMELVVLRNRNGDILLFIWKRNGVSSLFLTAKSWFRYKPRHATLASPRCWRPRLSRPESACRPTRVVRKANGVCRVREHSR